MYFGISLIVIGALLVASKAQFPQYPPQFSDNPLPQPFNPLQQSFNPYRTGGYQHFQLRSPPPPRFNPFEHVFNEKGEKLTCKMVCSPSDDSEDIDESLQNKRPQPTPEKKDSGENRIEKKEE